MFFPDFIKLLKLSKSSQTAVNQGTVRSSAAAYTVSRGQTNERRGVMSATGRVKSFNGAKGFGFIDCPLAAAFYLIFWGHVARIR